MDINVFEFQNYRIYTAKKLKHGEQARLAEAIFCQPSYLSRVLKGNINFSIEQGVLVNEYFQHNDAEAEFFMALLLEERSGSKKSKDYFATKVDQLRKTQHRLQAEMKKKYELSTQKKLLYYSNSDFALVHMLLSAVKEQQQESIAKILGLPAARVKQVLEDLLQMGLVKIEKGKYQIAEAHVHLGRDEIFTDIHHRNFRSWMTQKVESKSNNFHFTGVYGFSQDTFEDVKEEISRTLQKINQLAAPSPEECGAVLCFDALKLV